jgi:hypothetical protein
MQREIGAEMWGKAPDSLADWRGMNGRERKISRARMSLIIAEPQVLREIGDEGQHMPSHLSIF